MNKDPDYINIVLSLFSGHKRRASKYSNPAIEHIMFMEKLCMMIDACLGFVKSENKEDEFISNEVDELVNIIRGDIEQLIMYIENPKYSPNNNEGLKVIIKDFSEYLKSLDESVSEVDSKYTLHAINGIKMKLLFIETYYRVRNRRINLIDNVIKYLMLLHEISLFVDFSIMGMRVDKQIQQPEKLTAINEMIDDINKSIVRLIKWIETPLYSPDHPLGNKMMNECGNDFNQRC